MELLTVGQMADADRLAVEDGPYSGYDLMLNAGRAVARLVLARCGQTRLVHVLCGPGNNGGDGYVAAVELSRAGMPVALYALAPPLSGKDAARARQAWHGPVHELGEFVPQPGDVVIDALFGAGLARDVTAEVSAAIARTSEAGCETVAVDVPTGISGDGGQIAGAAFLARHTVTFFRKKPGHLLLPGRAHCGKIHLVDIGIRDSVLDRIQPRIRENIPELWLRHWPRSSHDLHKYSRGAVGVFSGHMNSTGAARLAAMAAQRAGAGAVTLFSPSDAMRVNACHLTSIMLAQIDTVPELQSLLRDGRPRAYVLGPGFGAGDRSVAFAFELMRHEHDGLVLDADAITALARQPDRFPGGEIAAPAPLVLTPHAGEFARLFPDLAANVSLSKLVKAQKAAERARAIVIFKGPDTVIAAPDGRSAINANATPALATAGSGDVLAGIVAALLSRKMPAYEAACAGVWLHGEAGRHAGNNCIAEDLPLQLPRIHAALERGALS